MEYKQIKTRKIYEEVADTLLDMIQAGEIKPGDKLDSVEQLAKNFNVGRSAIREALSALRAMGLVEMHQGEGTYVKKFDPSRFSVPVSVAFLMKKEDIKELLEVRKILEVGVARSAAENYLQDDLIRMEEALEEMAHANGNEEIGEQADFNFHMAIAAATHNNMLISLMESVSKIMLDSMKEMRRLWLFSEESTVNLIEEHRKIFEEIRSRDSNNAQQIMLMHIAKVENTLLRYMD